MRRVSLFDCENLLRQGFVRDYGRRREELEQRVCSLVTGSRLGNELARSADVGRAGKKLNGDQILV